MFIVFCPEKKFKFAKTQDLAVQFVTEQLRIQAADNESPYQYFCMTGNLSGSYLQQDWSFPGDESPRFTISSVTHRVRTFRAEILNIDYDCPTGFVVFRIENFVAAIGYDCFYLAQSIDQLEANGINDFVYVHEDKVPKWLISYCELRSTEISCSCILCTLLNIRQSQQPVDLSDKFADVFDRFKTKEEILNNANQEFARIYEVIGLSSRGFDRKNMERFKTHP